jgi:hypothetical protein
VVGESATRAVAAELGGTASDVIRRALKMAIPFWDGQNNKYLLPGNYTDEVSGVYRLFAQNTEINRC